MKLSDFLRGTGDTVSEDAHLRALNGEEMHFDVGTYGHHYHVSLRPLRHRRGEIVGVAGLALDTTASRQADEARRELELRMVQTQKLESLGILAGGIAHDFNNLLVGVLGNAGIALSEVATDHPAHEPLVSIEHAAQRMRDLTRQLLAYSGRGKFLTRALDLNDVLRESRDFVAAGMSRKIEFLVEYDSEPLPIRADPVQLRQLLLNLASNASDSLEDKPGRIRLATHRRRLTPVELPQMVEIPPSLDGEFAVIEMEDNGCGMAAEIITRIFDPFYTTKAQGRGLGLAAVSGIVRSHGGGIQIQSIPRNGTTVRIFLPLLEETPLPLAPTLRERRLEGTILVADDEQVILDFVRPVLERAGLNVLVARDGEAALHLYEEHSTAISMVILDVIMPRLGGAETYLELRKRNPRLPALFISGATDQDLTRKGLRVSPHHVLTKPFTHEQLLAKVGAFF
jgi:signal transduction histidine kinase